MQSKRASRKKRQSPPQPPQQSLRELKDKLRQKLYEKNTERKCQFARAGRLVELEKKVKKTEDPEKLEKIRDEIAFIEKTFEKDLEYNNDHASYTDQGDFGGGFEHPD